MFLIHVAVNIYLFCGKDAFGDRGIGDYANSEKLHRLHRVYRITALDAQCEQLKTFKHCLVQPDIGPMLIWPHPSTISYLVLPTI